MRALLAAQARSAAALATALDVPVAARCVRALTPAPLLEEVRAAGVPSTLARPAGPGGRPAAVLLNGVTARGRAHPRVRALAEGLARAGLLVLVPDPAGLARGELTPATLADTLAASRWLAGHRDAAGGRVALLGISAGTSLALLAAEAEGLAGRVSVVAGTAPFADLREVARIATTATYRGHGRLLRWRAPSFLGLVIARSLVGGLAPGQDQERLRDLLLAEPDETRAPFAALAGVAAPRAPDAAAVCALLVNTSPERFDALYGELPPHLREGLAALSPLVGAGRVRARVELVSAPRDAYFPLGEARALAAATGGRLTVTTTLDHAVPRPVARDLRDLGRFGGWVARSLAAAATGIIPA
jgi:hypothetical protein